MTTAIPQTDIDITEDLLEAILETSPSERPSSRQRGYCYGLVRELEAGIRDWLHSPAATMHDASDMIEVLRRATSIMTAQKTK